MSAKARRTVSTVPSPTALRSSSSVIDCVPASSASALSIAANSSSGAEPTRWWRE